MPGNKLAELSVFFAFGLLVPCAFPQGSSTPPPPPQQVIPPNVGIPVVAPPVVTPKAAADAAEKAPQEPAPDKTTSPGKSAKGKSSSSKTPPQATATGGKDPVLRPAYVIGPDDSLFIRVWKQGDLSGGVTVGPDGMISMQLINEVKAAGLTTDQLKAVLIEKLSKFINEPEVNVQVTTVRSRTYIIQGEVLRTGVFPLIKPTTILEALVNGGGFGPFANKKKIYVLRGSERIYFNWNEVSKGKHMEQNIEVQNGDQIFVP
jgi:polysaccharide biosynthesis/export protein